MPSKLIEDPKISNCFRTCGLVGFETHQMNEYTKGFGSPRLKPMSTSPEYFSHLVGS